VWHEQQVRIALTISEQVLLKSRGENVYRAKIPDSRGARVTLRRDNCARDGRFLRIKLCRIGLQQIEIGEQEYEGILGALSENKRSCAGFSRKKKNGNVENQVLKFLHKEEMEEGGEGDVNLNVCAVHLKVKGKQESVLAS